MDFQNAEFYKLNKNNPDLIFNYATGTVTYRKEATPKGKLRIVEYRKDYDKKETTRRIVPSYEFSAEDFDIWKQKLMDEALEQRRHDDRTTRNNVNIDNLLETDLVATESVADEMIREEDDRQAYERQMKKLNEILSCLIIPIMPIVETPTKVRVAAYVRVSTSKDDQLNSFAAQYIHYKKLFEDSTYEELIDIYSDEGISGTTTDKRDGFNRMLDDCEKGRIQKIYVKSISRFGRNTAESLAHIRYLKTLGISVFFEKENLDTAIEETEFRLTMMEYHAQEESISISKNVRLGEQYKMERGDYLLKVAPYGYERYERTLIVNEAEAVIVRRIYADYTSGKSTRQIADELNEENVPRKDPAVAWKRTAVEYILSNEKYIGDQMYLKRYRTDTFPFVRVRNHGEHVYYYVEETHEPIVTRTVFDYAQKLRTARVPKCVTTASEYTPLSGAIHCAECGKVFRIVNRQKSVQWACRTHHRNVADCPVKCVPEAEVIRAFVEMYNKLKANRKVIITPVINQLVTLKNRISAQSVEFAELDRQIMLINDQLALIADLKQKQMIDEETFRRKSNELNSSMSSLRSKRRLFLNNSQADQAIADMKRLASIIDKGPDKIDELDEELFDSLVEDIVVDTSDEIKFKLIGGLVLKEAIERTKR